MFTPIGVDCSANTDVSNNGHLFQRDQLVKMDLTQLGKSQGGLFIPLPMFVIARIFVF
jgi:hypothetical protein